MDKEEAYNRGYEDGFEDNCYSRRSVPVLLEIEYTLGYDKGLRDRQEVDRASSSNA